METADESENSSSPFSNPPPFPEYSKLVFPFIRLPSLWPLALFNIQYQCQYSAWHFHSSDYLGCGFLLHPAGCCDSGPTSSCYPTFPFHKFKCLNAENIMLKEMFKSSHLLSIKDLFLFESIFPAITCLSSLLFSLCSHWFSWICTMYTLGIVCLI